VEDIEGEEGDQQEALDGVGVVPVDVVGVPAFDQFIEPVIFDIPSLVAEGDGRLGGDRPGRQHPDTGCAGRP